MPAGMCLLDTTDGALMSALYTSSSFAPDDIAILYYSIVLTIVTVIVATIIGTIQVFSLILNVAEPKGPFWDGVEKASDMYDIIGGCIAGLFVIAGVASVLAYDSWRRWVDEGRVGRLGLLVGDVEAEEEEREPGGGAKLRKPAEEEDLAIRAAPGTSQDRIEESVYSHGPSLEQGSRK